MQGSKDVRVVCRALGVHISSAPFSSPSFFFFCSFHFQLIFISIDKLNLINKRRGGELVPFNFSFFTASDVKKKKKERCAHD